MGTKKPARADLTPQPPLHEEGVVKPPRTTSGDAADPHKYWASEFRPRRFRPFFNTL